MENDTKLATCFKPFPLISCLMLGLWLKELNPRRRVYIEISKPARVVLK
jgi:hypothetical protein